MMSSVNSFAGNGNIYLGGTVDVNQCAILAGARGFQVGIWGAGVDDFGIYYPYFNACFGKSYNTPPVVYPPIPVPLPFPPYPGTGPQPQAQVQGAEQAQATMAATPSGRTVVLAPTMDANSAAAVLLNGMADYAAEGHLRPVFQDEARTGYTMDENGLSIHCHNAGLGNDTSSLAVQVSACEVSVNAPKHTVLLPETAISSSVSAVLMGSLRKQFENGNGKTVVRNSTQTGYVMKAGRLNIHCFSTPVSGTSLAVETQGCQISIR